MGSLQEGASSQACDLIDAVDRIIAARRIGAVLGMKILETSAKGYITFTFTFFHFTFTFFVENENDMILSEMKMASILWQFQK
jgi:hypothetical protein